MILLIPLEEVNCSDDIVVDDRDRNRRRKILAVRRLTNWKKVVADEVFVEAVDGQSLDVIGNKTHSKWPKVLNVEWIKKWLLDSWTNYCVF